jgi:hypothetical protein
MKEAPETVKCTKCATMIPRKGLPTTLSVGREGTTAETIDHVIGADAARRWDYYHKRIEERDQVRLATKSPSLSQTDTGYVPLSEERKELRRKAYAPFEKD